MEDRKSICRHVVKPNVVHNEEELSREIECAIFPYSEIDGKFVIMEESVLRRQFPYAYGSLSKCRAVLAARDKGKGDYPAWWTALLNARTSAERNRLVWRAYGILDEPLTRL